MSNVKELIQSLSELDGKNFTPEKRAAVSSSLLAILKACRDKDLQELDRQTKMFVSLTYDPNNVFLGYTPELPSAPPELFNEIENKTLAVLEKIEASESDARN